jgi:hypothetical protein
VTSLYIDTTDQALRQATRSFTDANGMPPNETLEQAVATKVSTLAKGMDLNPSGMRHLAILALNNEKRIASGNATAEHRDDLAMRAIADLRTRVRSAAMAWQIIHGTNAHLKAHRPDIHATLKSDSERGGSLGSEPFVVRHLTDYYRKHEADAERRTRASGWPAKKQAEHASDSVAPGGLLSSHPPSASYIRRVRALQASDPSAGPSDLLAST